MWLAVFLLAPVLGKHLAGGYAHFCIVQPNAQTFCFGWNKFGNLGNGSPNETSSFPTQVLDVEDTVDVCAGGGHSCFLSQDGYVQCVGFNSEGMLGDGTTEDKSRAGDAVNATGLVSQIECSFFQTCAVLAQGMECWGGNSFGELGDNSTVSKHFPVPMLGLESVTVHSVGTGVFHTCVVVGNGQVRCTGGNSAGQLGSAGEGLKSSAVLVPVWGLDQEVAMSVRCGYEHSCVVMSTGKVYCWGGNAVGQLGLDSTVTFSPHPVAVGGLGSFVSCGYFNSFVVNHNTGVATVFGDNAFNQFATTGKATYFTPEPAFANLSIAEIRSGYRTACVATTHGTVHCVGADAYGQLGNGSNTASSRLVDVALPMLETALTPGQIQCQPRAAMSRLRCTVLTKLCKSLHNIQLKWVGSGCKNRKVKDAGCQCLGYCGFTCKQECNKNRKYCQWSGARGCTVKASKQTYQRKTYCDLGL
ncbi:hypothetical protein BASA81_001643 [Batrachochytrium salamandrivorans]|nr:hypothetical protein BASA81_001643 [Batrachochytrium salamandrivorans]